MAGESRMDGFTQGALSEQDDAHSHLPGDGPPQLRETPMLPQAFALRPVELCDLPTLKRWRSLPSVQSHLRHPTPPTWPQHLAWWWRIHHDPTCRVFAVTLEDELVGQAGWYYRRGHAAE